MHLSIHPTAKLALGTGSFDEGVEMEHLYLPSSQEYFTIMRLKQNLNSGMGSYGESAEIKHTCDSPGLRSILL